MKEACQTKGMKTTLAVISDLVSKSYLYNAKAQINIIHSKETQTEGGMSINALFVLPINDRLGEKPFLFEFNDDGYYSDRSHSDYDCQPWFSLSVEDKGYYMTDDKCRSMQLFMLHYSTGVN